MISRHSCLRYLLTAHLTRQSLHSCCLLWQVNKTHGMLNIFGEIAMRLWWNLIRQGASLLFITELPSSNTPSRWAHLNLRGKYYWLTRQEPALTLWPFPITCPSSSLSPMHVLTHKTRNIHTSCTQFLPSGILRDGREVENMKRLENPGQMWAYRKGMMEVESDLELEVQNPWLLGCWGFFLFTVNELFTN